MTNHVAFALAVLDMLGSRPAAADGERTPLCGLAVVGAETTQAPDQHADLVGVALDLAWWHGRFGLAAEGSARWSVGDQDARAFVLGGSARLRVVEGLLPSIMDPRDVELGVELQAIVERTWWKSEVRGVEPIAYGFGLALRLRGSGDMDSPTLMAESRFFVRVMSSRWSEPETIARTMAPVSMSDRALTVLAGIGASFGAGAPAYMERFRLRPSGHSIL